MEHDPDFALAHIGMAEYYAFMVFRNYLPSKEGFPKAEEWLRSAEALEPNNLDALKRLNGAIKFWYKWDWASALKDLEMANTVERNSTSIEMLAWYYVVVGNFGKAIETIKAAVELDPLNPIRKRDLAVIYSMAGNYAESVRICLSILEADSHNSEAYLTLSNNYRHLGQIDEAIKSGEKAVAMQEGKGWSRADLGKAYIAAGRRAEALELIDAMLKEERAVYVPKIALATLYFKIGEIDEGFEWMEKAYESRDYWLPAWLNNPRQQDAAIRADPRFQDMVDRMNFPK